MACSRIKNEDYIKYKEVLTEITLSPLLHQSSF